MEDEAKKQDNSLSLNTFERTNPINIPISNAKKNRLRKHNISIEYEYEVIDKHNYDKTQKYAFKTKNLNRKFQRIFVFIIKTKL